jgi:DNA-binding NtrC family response regulator
MLEGCKILVVDDEANMREMLLDLLKAHGVAVTAESDLESAKAAIESNCPDILILDLKLPDGSGLDLLKALKEAEQSPEVIMMSAFGTVESAVRAVQAGAFDFIVKPFNIEDILRVILPHGLPCRRGRDW